MSVKSAALGHGTHLRIGVSDCMAYCRMTEVIARYRALNVAMSVSLHEMPLHQQVSWIRDNLLDASISLDGSHRDGVHAQAITRDEICAVIPAAHPLAQAEVMSVADLACYSLILFSTETDLGTGSEMREFVENLGRPHVAFHAKSLGTMLTLVALGHGIGLIGSGQMAGVKRRDIVLRAIAGAHPSPTTYVLHSSSGLSEPLELFVELARDLLNGESLAALS